MTPLITNPSEPEEAKPDWVKVAKRLFLIGVMVLASFWLVSAIVDLSIFEVYWHFLDNVKARLRIDTFLANAVSLAFLVPFALGVKYYLFSFRNKKRRNAGLAILLTMGVLYNLVLYLGTRNENFDPNGNASKFYALVPGDVVFSDRAGTEARYGAPFRSVTRENIRWLVRIKEGRIESVADPAHHDWFDGVTRDPLLWYYADSSSNFHFFDGPGYARSTGDQLQPVTPEIRRQWETKIREASAGTQQRATQGKAQEDVAQRNRERAARDAADMVRRAGYLYATHLPAKVDFVVCAATAARVPMNIFSAALVKQFASRGKTASNIVFSPAFVTEGAFDSFFAGRGGADLQDMPVSTMGNKLFLARMSINSVKPGTSAIGLFSTSIIVAFSILSSSDGSVVDGFELKTVGAGTSEADAISTALDRTFELLGQRGY